MVEREDTDGETIARLDERHKSLERRVEKLERSIWFTIAGIMGIVINMIAARIGMK